MFSYSEARQLWGINERTFRDSIIQLIEHGFLKIEQQGGTLQGTRECTLYMLVNDWERYGTPSFIKPEISKVISHNDNLRRINADRKKSFSPEPGLSRRLTKSSAERAKRGGSMIENLSRESSSKSLKTLITAVFTKNQVKIQTVQASAESGLSIIIIPGVGGLSQIRCTEREMNHVDCRGAKEHEREHQGFYQ